MLDTGQRSIQHLETGQESSEAWLGLGWGRGGVFSDVHGHSHGVERVGPQLGHCTAGKLWNPDLDMDQKNLIPFPCPILPSNIMLKCLKPSI